MTGKHSHRQAVKKEKDRQMNNGNRVCVRCFRKTYPREAYKDLHTHTHRHKGVTYQLVLCICQPCSDISDRLEEEVEKRKGNDPRSRKVTEEKKEEEGGCTCRPASEWGPSSEWE